MLQQILIPNTGIPSFFSGSGVGEPAISNLQTLPSTGSNSSTSLVNNGTTIPDFTTFWTNDPHSSAPKKLDAWFDIGFDSLTLSTLSGVVGRLVFSLGNTNVDLSGVSLIFKKSNNSTLSNDIQFASGNVLTNRMTGNTSGVMNFGFNIIQANRSSFPTSNGTLSLSGYLISQNAFQDTVGRTNFVDFDLVVSGTSLINNNIPLYINGSNPPSSNNIQLFTNGNVPSTPTLTSGNMPLYLQGQTADSGNNNIPLFCFATINSGQFNTIPLFLGYTEGTPDPQYSLPLYIGGPSSNTSVSPMNLFLCNDTNINNNFTLFLQNNYTQIGSGLPLFIASPSGTDGAVPYSGSMNLFIARDSESLSIGIPLYLATTESINNNINLYISGMNSSNNNLTLFIPSIDSGTIGNFNLYAQGF